MTPFVSNSPATGAAVLNDTTPTEGTAVTANTAGIADANGLGAFSFQWLSNGVAIAGVDATDDADFTPTAAQVNTTLSLRVSFNDLAGNAEVVTSAASTVVGNLFTDAVGNATIGSSTVFNGVGANGTPGQDLLSGNDLADQLFGGLGDDTLNGDGGGDTLNGGDGNDTLNGNAGVDTLNGGDGNDRMTGGAGVDTYNGGAGDDTYVVADAGEGITDVSGIDTVETTLLTYTLGAALENLTKTNGGSVATLTGNALNNVILGGTGDDDITGAAGVDTMSGRGGVDFFVYNAVAETGIGAGLRDIITDFGTTDVIDLGAIAGTFAFVAGGGAFGVTATNQVRAIQVDTGGAVGVDSTVIQLDNDTNADVDAEILLQGYLVTVVAGDFVL